MAWDFESGTSGHLFWASAIVSGPPFTVAAWFKAESRTADRCVFGVSNGVLDWWQLTLRSDGNNGALFGARDNTTFGTADWASGDIGDGEWRHIAAVESSSSSRALYVDGIQRATNTTDVTPDAVSDTAIASLRGNLNNFDGLIGEVAVWSKALGPQALAQLGQGASPLFFPHRLVLYYGLRRSLAEEVPASVFTENGGAILVQDHPKIISPVDRRIVYRTPARNFVTGGARRRFELNRGP